MIDKKYDKKYKKLSTEKAMTNEILDNLYLMTRSHEPGCICILCDLKKVIKNEEEKPKVDKKDDEKDDKYHFLTIADYKKLRFIPLEDGGNDKRFKDVKITCPFCGDTKISKRVEYRGSYIKNEYVLDCGHFIRVGGHYMIESEDI